MKSILYYLCAITFLLFYNYSSAQNFHILKDINTATDSYPSNSIYLNTGGGTDSYALLNGISYFRASDGLHGTELWRSDGTPAGTYMLKDINTGVAGSNINSISIFKNELYFSAYTPEFGIELWKSDGTEAGTTIVKDVNPGAANSNPSFIMNNGNELFFAVSYSGNVCQFWKSNGTDTGTVLIKDFDNNANFIYSPVIVGSKICFLVYYNNTFPEVWATDGSSANTTKIASLSTFFDFGIFNSNGETLFFSDQDNHLWKSDGTSAGTSLLAKFGNHLSYFTLYHNLLIFISDNTFFKCDGGSLQSFAFISGNLKYGATINDAISYFSLVDNKYELWKTNPLTFENTMIERFDSSYLSDINALSAIENNLYFSGYNNDNGFELWKSNGMVDGTKEIKDIFPDSSGSYPRFFSSFKKNILFNASDGIHGSELWTADTTTGSTTLVKDINLSYTSSSDPAQLAVLNNTLFFSARNDAYGNELWKTNGTEQNTVLVKDINKASLSGVYNDIPIKSGPNLYFRGNTLQTGNELWKTNGNASNTNIIGDLTPGATGSIFQFFSPFEKADVNGRLYFTISPVIDSLGNSSGNAIYTTNGIDSLTLITHPSNYINNLTALNDKLVYTLYPSQLWITDSTAATNIQITAAQPEYTDGSLFTYKNFLYYYSATDGYMWKTDGTNANTKLFKKISPFPYYSSYYSDIYNYESGYFVSANAVLNEDLYFSADDATHGSELWKTDGTPQGTSLVRDINNGIGASQLGNFVVVDTILYFFANDGIHGRELWKTDGTSKGTALVKDITAGNASSEVFSVTQLQNKIVFFLYDQTNKVFNLWQSDGTATGTHKVNDVRLNDVQMVPPLRVINNQIYFAAKTIENGNELWVGTLDGVLATQLFNFSGTLLNNDAQLKWSTNEQKLSYFNLQRSVDGIHFTTIMKLLSKGNLTEKADYQYFDKNIAALNSKNIYYRLEAVDNDGNSSLSNVVLLKLKTESLFVSIKPNPVVSNFNIQINQVQTLQQVRLQIINSTGNTIFSENRNINTGSNLLSYNSSSWLAGMYIINLSFADGSVKQIKLIKQ